MASKGFELATAIAAELNEQAFFMGAGVTATARHAVHMQKLDGLEQIEVSAVPAESVREPRDRNHCRKTFATEIVFRKRVSGADGLPDAGEVDDVLALAEAVADYRFPDRLAGCTWTQTEITQTMDDGFLYEDWVAVSVVRITHVL